MDHVQWDERPRLRKPVLVAAFEGWNDAADAATIAARYLGERWGARPFASIDPEEFFDFSSTRPQVRLVEGVTRRIDWPANRFSAASIPGAARDVVLLVGTEPQLRWRTFCAEVAGVAGELGVELVVTLGALLADVPHTRPVRITGTAANPELAGRLGLQRSRYEGPTGIVGVLHDAFAKTRVPSASLWAAVPHYVAATPSPKAALALVEQASQLLDASVVTADLAQLAVDYERQVSEVVEADEDVAAYVRRLEASADEEPQPNPLRLSSGESLAAEVERFLREQGE
jgi:predicted ATP-grasp superfamily ATP-dependent carboligase